MAIFVPVHEGGTTHCTANLSGFPAVDFMGSLGEPVHLEEAVRVYDPHLTTWQQGFGGWTLYAVGESGATYFITHLDETQPTQAGDYGPGAIIGYLTRSAAHAALINGAHVHVGNTSWPDPPGLNCGAAPSNVVRGRPNFGHSTSIGKAATNSADQSASENAKDSRLPGAFKHLVHALGVTVPTQTALVDRVTKNYTRIVSPRG